MTMVLKRKFKKIFFFDQRLPKRFCMPKNFRLVQSLGIALLVQNMPIVVAKTDKEVISTNSYSSAIYCLSISLNSLNRISKKPFLVKRD